MNTKTLVTSTLLLFAISCGSSDPTSSNPNLNAMLSSMKQLAGCTPGGTYTAPTAAQITEIENACTATDINKLKTYLSCLAPATCSATPTAASITCAPAPTISAQCQTLMNS